MRDGLLESPEHLAKCGETETKPAVRWDRWTAIAMLIAACIIIPRSILILRAHNEYLDDQAHIRRGLTLAEGNPADVSIMLTDPPGGDALLVLPMIVTKCWLTEPIHGEHWPGGSEAHEAGRPNDEQRAWRARPMRVETLYGYWLSPETITMMIGLWKSILFVPLVGLVFQWCRELYGMGAGWLAMGMLLFEPNFIGHVPTGALDSLGVEGIAFACYVGWRCVQKPSWRRVIAASLTVGLAMVIKHIAIILPWVIAIYAALTWWRLRREGAAVSGFLPDDLSPRAHVFRKWLIASCILVVSIWAFTLFDISRPRDFCWPMEVRRGGGFSIFRDVVDPLLDFRLPAGMFIGSIIGGFKHSEIGNWSYLWGKFSFHGFWYYFPVAMTYKVPIGIWVVLVLGLASFRWRRPRRSEVSLIVPLLMWLALLLNVKVNIGFRHFLPPYLFMLMLASRCLSADASKRWIAIVAWLGVAAAAIHGLTYHPDYIAYFNWPRHKPYLAINDSNVDWGQSLKEVRGWIDSHPQYGRTIWLGNFWDDRAPGIKYYLGNRVTALRRTGERPTGGLLIISPAWEAGVYDYYDAYGALRDWEPMDVIGHNMLVYDLDEMFNRGFKWIDLAATTKPVESGS